MSSSSPYTVLGWFLTHGGNTGPRLIFVCRRRARTRVMFDRSLFPPNTNVTRTHVHINDSVYRVFFDRDHHQHQHACASYFFVRMLNPARAVDIWPENDINDLLDVLAILDERFPLIVNTNTSD
ncbi:hypothetical protein BKA82DRAFT_22860 [Pisolithus tinctorius]|uniref:Uncharacterized protein n=1 Tax=Pisolithus tinctorius Marx 270 TaxID=870435 RepID=A0A0C3JGR6_PISTI|nr:hypothetical protein BKA82DRAFT_22860 [Pisolithus tinctorius]KIO08258.1 hypothetical protein M404DRAFT_22860 [Pisolithus tinctorius Marx 270]